jgi:hypothetical protein
MADMNAVTWMSCRRQLRPEAVCRAYYLGAKDVTFHTQLSLDLLVFAFIHLELRLQIANMMTRSASFAVVSSSLRRKVRSQIAMFHVDGLDFCEYFADRTYS